MTKLACSSCRFDRADSHAGMILQRWPSDVTVLQGRASLLSDRLGCEQQGVVHIHKNHFLMAFFADMRALPKGSWFRLH